MPTLTSAHPPYHSESVELSIQTSKCFTLKLAKYLRSHASHTSSTMPISFPTMSVVVANQISSSHRYRCMPISLPASSRRSWSWSYQKDCLACLMSQILGMLKQGKITFGLLLPLGFRTSSPCFSKNFKDNKKAVITTGLKIKALSRINVTMLCYLHQ